MTDPDENGEELIDEQGRNATQQRIDEEDGMSEVIPEDEDRGGDGAIGGALADDDEGGTGPDDGGPGSQNM